jgi:hypothetical protein
MARGGGGFGLAALGGVAIAVLMLAIVFSLAPTIGGTIEGSMPALAADSDWNASYNTDLKTGGDIWAELSPFVVVVAFVMMAGIIFLVLRGVL